MWPFQNIIFDSGPADNIIAETNEQSDTNVWVTFRGDKSLITVQFGIKSPAWFHPARRFVCFSDRARSRVRKMAYPEYAKKI